MIRYVAATEQTAMHLRMKCFHTTIADLRKACDVADVDNVNTVFTEFGHSASGGDDLPSEVLE